MRGISREKKIIVAGYRSRRNDCPVHIMPNQVGISPPESTNSSCVARCAWTISYYNKMIDVRSNHGHTLYNKIAIWIHHPVLAPNFFLFEALVGEYRVSIAAPR